MTKKSKVEMQNSKPKNKSFCPAIENHISNFQEITLDILQRRILFRGFEQHLSGEDVGKIDSNDFLSFYKFDYFRSQLVDIRKFFDKDKRSYTINFILQHLSCQSVKQEYTNLKSKWAGNNKTRVNFRDLVNKSFAHRSKGYKPPPEVQKKALDDLVDELNTFVGNLVEQLTSEGYSAHSLIRNETSGYLKEQQDEFGNLLKIVCSAPRYKND